MEEGNTKTVAEEIVKLASWGYWEGSMMRTLNNK